MSITALDTRQLTVTAPARTRPNRKTLGAAVAAGCLIDLVAAYLFRVWHPAPFGWGGDFYTEALAPLKVLAHGHVLTFIKTGPAYLGGVVIEAALALPGIWLGLSGSAVYYLAVVPAILAAPALAGWSIHRRGGQPRISDLPLALIVLNPVTLCCLGFGHPEDLLAACLVLAAVIEGSRGSARAPIILIAVAIAVQPFAILAAPLVWSVSPHPRRIALMSILATAVFWLPVITIHEVSLGAGDTAGFVGAGVGAIDYPEQFFYWFGSNNWCFREAHMLIPLGAAALTGLWHLQQRSRPAADKTTEALWLLALLLLIRCAFDPWDTPYYHLPFLMVLMALDARSTRRLPIMSVAASFVAFSLVSPDAHAATADPHLVAVHYTVVAGVALVLLAVRVYAPQRCQILRQATQRRLALLVASR
jgi:hypothetical protein